VSKSRAYLSQDAQKEATKETLSREFVDSDGDGVARFLIYDYGPGDTVTMPTVISVEAAD